MRAVLVSTGMFLQLQCRQIVIGSNGTSHMVAHHGIMMVLLIHSIGSTAISGSIRM